MLAALHLGHLEIELNILQCHQRIVSLATITTTTTATT
jgi:hypothetical protein